jgi:CYTH domain-containing protein
MGVEIERRFLVVGEPWSEWGQGVDMQQGYIAREGGNTVRVRIAGARAWLTLKGPTVGATRAEFEYPLPIADAHGLLALAQDGVIVKTRWRVDVAGRIWGVDQFAGANAPLAIAEVELDREDADVVVPPWAGTEITGDHRYANASLASRPFDSW